MNTEEIEKALTEGLKAIKEMKNLSGQKPSRKTPKKTSKKPVEKLPEISSKDIPKLINKMNKVELKTIFGLDIGKNKENPYRCTVKELIRKYNIVSGNKYPVYLKYENKHAIIKKLYGDKPKKICIDYLKSKIPDAKNSYVEKALQQEINRWE